MRSGGGLGIIYLFVEVLRRWPFVIPTFGRFRAKLHRSKNNPTHTTHCAALYPFLLRRLSPKRRSVCLWVAANALLHFTYKEFLVHTHKGINNNNDTHMCVCSSILTATQDARHTHTHSLKGKRGNRPDSKRPLESRSVSSRTRFFRPAAGKKKQIQTQREKRSKPCQWWEANGLVTTGF